MGVAYTLAHQFLGQLTPAMRTAVLANTRSRICFQLSPDDAGIIARSTPDLEPVDFTSLSRYQVYAALYADGHTSGFASGRTVPSPKAISSPTTIRRASRERYGRRLDDIEREFAELASPAGTGNQERPGRARRTTS